MVGVQTNELAANKRFSANPGRDRALRGVVKGYKRWICAPISLYPEFGKLFSGGRLSLTYECGIVSSFHSFET
jgi:hypothetical protein